MLLEQLLNFHASGDIRKVLISITSQLNLLLSLVNDVLDLKLIKQGIYDSKLGNFNP